MSEVDANIIQKTQDRLTKYFKKPPLTEKLLSRPPFRFLHDIFTAIISNTGFMKGLFTEDELKSENIKEKEMKIKFLDKVISIVSLALNKTIDVKSSSIIAGKDAVKTNLFLQELGKAIEKSAKDNKNLVAQVLSGNSKKTKPKESSKDEKEPSKKSRDKLEKDKKQTTEDNKPTKKKELNDKEPDKKDSKNKTEKKHRDKKEAKSEIKEVKSEIKEKEPETSLKPKKSRTEKDPSKNIQENEQVIEPSKNDETRDESESQMKLQRPSSAKGSRHTRREKEPNHDELNLSEKITKPTVSSQRPPSARPAPPRKINSDTLDPNLPEPANPQSKVKGVIMDKDSDSEDDFVVEEYTGGGEIDFTSDNRKLEENNDEENDGEHGLMVQKILESKKEFIDIPTNNEGLSSAADANRKRDRFITQKEMEKLRLGLQNVTKNIQPIGKLIDFIQEDFDSMQKEKNKWRKEKMELMSKYKVETNKIDQSIRPIKDKIEEQNSLKKQYEDIISKLHSQIMDNTKKIDLIFINSCNAA